MPVARAPRRKKLLDSSGAHKREKTMFRNFCIIAEFCQAHGCPRELNRALECYALIRIGLTILVVALFLLWQRHANVQAQERSTTFPVQESGEEWKKQLSAHEFHILRQRSTEPVGRASLSPSGSAASSRKPIRPGACRAPRCSAPTAAGISGMCSRMAPGQRGCATASTAPV